MAPSAEAARQLALRVLAQRARTEAQLRARLTRAGMAEHVDEVIPWLRRLGYLDDEQYATLRARDLLARQRGPRHVARALVQAGIGADRAREAVRRALEERDAGPAERAELALCREAMRRRLRGADPRSLERAAAARLARFLLGRGFSATAVARATGLALDVEDLDTGE